MPHSEFQKYWFQESIRDQKFEENFDIGKELGRGATAVVYKCTRKSTDQAWAVKIMDKRLEQKTIVTEVGILLKLDHENIIRLKEIYETEENVYMLLELVTGGELFERIVNKGFYSEQQAAAAVKDIVLAVDYLHKNNVVHRDLKPENILYENLSPESKLKVADFGLSTMMANKVSLMTVCGTPGYCAPEVLKGEKYNEMCDMWSLGVITYILLCGYEPFFCENEKEMFKKILKADYKFDSPWWDDVSENAKDLVRKLLTLDPKKRLTPAAALKHVWVTGQANKKTHKDGTVELIKQFNARRKLKATTDALMAVVGATNNTPLFQLLSENVGQNLEQEMDVN